MKDPVTSSWWWSHPSSCDRVVGASPAHRRRDQFPAALRGRVFGPEDRPGSTPVIVINRALAHQYFKGQDPVGQRLAFTTVVTPTTRRYTIIGIAGNEHVDVAPRIEAFHAEAQAPSDYMMALARTTEEPTALVPSMRAVLHQLDPGLALLSVDTMDGLRGVALGAHAGQVQWLVVRQGLRLTLLGVASGGFVGAGIEGRPAPIRPWRCGPTSPRRS